jgi:hypothetical protein
MAFCPVSSCPVVQPRVLVLYWGICNPRAWIFVEALDCLITYGIEFYIGCIAFLLGYIYLMFGSIMACMHVSLVEPSFRTVMGWVPTLEYMLSGVRGLLQLCPILLGHERYHPSRLRRWPCLSGNGSDLGGLTRCSGLSRVKVGEGMGG